MDSNFTHQYYIWTENQESAFQVKADYLRIFKRTDFITRITLGDTLNIYYSKGTIGEIG